MCDFEKNRKKIFVFAEIIFYCLSIIIVVFSRLIISKINKSEQLKIKVDFDSITNKNKLLLNYLKDEIENNTTNIYEKFFEKYNLTKGETLGTNEKLLSCFKILYFLKDISHCYCSILYWLYKLFYGKVYFCLL